VSKKETLKIAVNINSKPIGKEIKMHKFMFKKSSATGLIFLLFVGILFSSCASSKNMTIGKETEALDTSQKSIGIITAKTSNQISTNYEPNIQYALLLSGEKEYLFGVETVYDSIQTDTGEFIISFQLPAGKYKLQKLYGISGIFPIIGNFQIPLNSEFNLEQNQIAYLGRVEAVNRERNSDDELRAGSIFPLIDQQVTGFAKGTFDVKIYDNYEEDIALIKENYPFIANYTIRKSVLPPWVRPSKEDM
jgi:hypothetical protein